MAVVYGPCCPLQPAALDTHSHLSLSCTRQLGRLQIGRCMPSSSSASVPCRQVSLLSTKSSVSFYWGQCEVRRRIGTSICASNGSAIFTDGEVEPPGNEIGHGWERKFERFGEVLSSGFPLWVSVACLLALWKPSAFVWVDARVQYVGITVTMLGMGMTLTLKELMGALAMPKELLAGIILQYTVMPTAGFVVSRLLQLPSQYAAGLILVACCPGGTASNIVTYLARGNVALSVLMTAASTFMAVVMTPLLTAKLVGQYVAVDGYGLLVSTSKMVLAPVLAGAVMTQCFPKVVKKLSVLAPTIAVLAVAVVCAGVIGKSASAILSSGFQVLLAVMALHGLGFSCGYIFPRLAGFTEATSRTISIEVGMQNSVLGVVLAAQHFSNPLTAVPCAVSSICHSIFGSVLASVWRMSPTYEQSTVE